MLGSSFTLEEMMFQVAQEARPEERLTVSEAAKKYIYVNQPGSFVGQFDPDYTPYMREPTDTLASREFTGLFFCGPVQTGKTNMLSSWVAHSLKIEPADMILYTMTQSAASDFTINRLDRLFQNNPELGRMLLKGSSSDSMYRKMFRNGMILTVSWPSPTEFASRSIPRVFLTDYDRMPQNVGNEGSPFVLAEKRTTTFRRNAMAAAESTPSFPIKDLSWSQRPEHPHEAPPTDGILGLYNQGDRRLWMWRCTSCDNAFEPDFKLLRWPDSSDFMESAQAAYMACPHCGQVYEHDGSADAPSKNEMNLNHARWLREGQLWLPDGFVTGKPRRSKYASFWLKGPAARFQTWETIVFEYLTALDHFNRTLDETMLQSTVNTRQALPYRPRKADSMRSPDSIRERAVDLGDRVVPPGGRFLVATVDVQKARFVVQVHAFGEGNDLWVIDRFDIKVSKRPDEEAGGYKWVQPGAHPEDWDLLVEQVITKTYPLSDNSGREMPIWLTMCDSGGQEGVTKNAYDFWRRLRWPPEADENDEDRVEVPPGAHAKFQLVIGRPTLGAPRYQITFPDSQRKDRYAGAKGEIPVGRIHTDLIKDQLDKALDRDERGGGHISFPAWLPKEFYDELCAEVRDEKGRWEKIRKRNESWDLLAYALAATLDSRINLERPKFWEKPPPWAAPWDENTFLILPNAGNEVPKPKIESALERLKRLGAENG